MSNQKRIPYGIGGGQFTTVVRHEPGVDLDAGKSDAQKVDDYTKSFKSVEAQANADMSSFARLTPSEEDKALRAAADNYVTAAIRHSSMADVSDIPAYGDTVVNESTGLIYGSARASARFKTAADGSNAFDGVQTVADAVTARALDTRDFMTADGVPMRARIVRKGASYGREGAKSATDDTVMFFDTRYDHAPMVGDPDDPSRERNGQFVSSYYVDTLTEDNHQGGLDLHGGVPDWTIDAQTYADVHAWVSKRSR